MTKTIKKISLAFMISALVGLGVGYTYSWQHQKVGQADAAQTGTPTPTTKVFTVEELAQYNGEQPDKPIYLAYNGKVYDVTTGKEYYDKDGRYHYLAGRDSTAELNFAGGGIIEQKYPVIGVLEPAQN